VSAILQSLRTGLRFHRALVICEVVLLASLLLFDRPLIRGDAVAYFMWTASLGKDFDMDLQNQAGRFGALNTYMAQFNPHTGRYATAFAWGTGIILLPAFWTARVLDKLPFMRINDEWFLSLQAYPFAYSLAAMLQVNLLTMITVALGYGSARCLNLSRWASALGSLAVAWGTPLYFYSAIQPLYAHASATFAHTLAAFLFIRASVTPSAKVRWWHWLAAGLVLGLAALARWQLWLTWLIFAALLLARRQWGPLGWLCAGFGAVAWHIPYTFNWMYGSPFSVPVDVLAGEQGFLGPPRYLIPVLFAADRGWFTWSPVALLGIIGLVLLLRHHRNVGLVLLAIVAAQVLVNASIRDWYGGEGFGLRRLTEIYPALVVGATTLLTAAGAAWKDGRRALSILAYGTVGAAAVYGLILVVASLIFGYFTDPHFGYVLSPPPATFANVLAFFFSPPKFNLIWPMMEHHFGPWAWTWPGP
jgi:hypothetical protein